MKDDFRELVKARIRSLPNGYIISLAGGNTVTKEKALDYIDKKDDIGELLIEADRHYFNLLKTGNILRIF